MDLARPRKARVELQFNGQTAIQVYVQETMVQGVKKSHKITVENVVVNPNLDDSLFTAPKSK